jgi:hypothetical protein
VQQDRRGEAADRHHPDGVGDDHQPLAVAAVGRHAGGQREQRQGEGPRERDDAGLGCRLRHCQNEQRVGD